MSKSFKIITLIVIPFIASVYILFFLPAPEPAKQNYVIESSEQACSESPVSLSDFSNKPDVPYVEAYTSDGNIASDMITIDQMNIKIETQSDIEFTAVPDNVYIPAYYNQLILPGALAPVYSFENDDHDLCFRAWGFYCKCINNIRVEKIEGFFPVSIKQCTSTTFNITLLSDEPIIDSTSLPEKTIIPLLSDSVPVKYYQISTEPPVYTVIDNQLCQDFRIFCSAGDKVKCYPCDINGYVSPGALPVDPATESQYLPDNVLLDQKTSVHEKKICYPCRTTDDLILTVIPPSGGSDEE